MFRNHQKGNVLVVVLFVIIVMGYLAASLARVGWSDHSALTKEFLGTKAWFAAQSSNDWVLTKFFPVGSSAAVSSLCDDIQAGTLAPENGLVDTGCRIEKLECKSAGQLPGETDDGDAGLYVFKSVATCGSGPSKVQRQQEVWVRE
ncbi:MSHA biogenesis protein MshP [Vibrio sp. B1FLJ16]|uniref:MSHA biogenesis protein MshP n=1 Tax=Vibrio sp. B1FLJ16 TaxID=2751178 RepID=UPI0015F728AF|nr:MSHA biogenesis protein MshP [Vibrio sp. B1FLJ16]CAD7813350.1 hypothetical protein ACOMICROBIO_EPCKBFOG_02653 [Vibrio sp. B1FLJ16]CAE6921189.1 hypothetical protein ACOMICROBIO_EPCKBFOG_02653 [Vibrio sp. B1FLJ16]